MSPESCCEIRQEVELIRRFTQTYRRQLAGVINTLNHDGSHPQGMRVCVEAVDMLLSSQAALADALDRLTRSAPAKPLRVA